MKCNVFLSSLLSLVYSINVAYAYTAGSVNIRVTGSVYIPACSINNSQSIDVDFGDMPINDVSSKKIVKSVSVHCPYNKGTPYIYITGNALNTANNNVLLTSMPNLGIALYQGDTDTPLKFGSSVTNGVEPLGHQIMTGLTSVNTEQSEFVFSARPYQYGNSLSLGSFNATANISISYL
ncbi:fimbrial protein [Escherichia coli]|uniref:fimbrial protein n=1 Tax=Escherichia coli TaxID=562 RepID=UPI0010CBD987|nr:fimbrial protein [Escherichia coli]GDI75033.1 fimbrial adapter PapF precursor [Escherichia coli]